MVKIPVALQFQLTHMISHQVKSSHLMVARSPCNVGMSSETKNRMVLIYWILIRPCKYLE